MITTIPFILDTPRLYATTAYYALGCDEIVRGPYHVYAPKPGWRSLTKPFLSGPSASQLARTPPEGYIDARGGYTLWTTATMRAVLSAAWGSHARDDYMRCALYLIHQAVYAQRYLHHPYSIGVAELASRCGASIAVAKRVVGDLEHLRIMRQERQGNNLLSICSAYSLREEFMPPQAALPSSSEN